jgi:hypothetical protein
MKQPSVETLKSLRNECVALTMKALHTLTPFLKVGGILLLVLSPAIGFLGLFWEQNFHVLETLTSQVSPLHTSPDWATVSRISPPSADAGLLIRRAVSLIFGLMLLVPFFLSFGLCLYSGYRNHRATILSQRIAQLERNWQLNIPLRRVVR